MSRSSHCYGLHDKAEEFLAQNCKTNITKCPCCENGMRETKVSHVYEDRSGPYGDEFPLSEYELKDGRKVREVEQVTHWDSGPNEFLCLEIVGTGEKLFLWHENEIKAFGISI